MFHPDGSAGGGKKAYKGILVMGRSWLATALLCVSALTAQAQGESVERQVRAVSGRDVRVGVYIDIKPDCTSGPLPVIRLLAAPSHGAVTVKRGTLKATNLKQCLATEVPALVAMYRAAANFNGTDEFALEVSFANGRKQLQHFRVEISATAAPAGQGI
jgi:hypothetical protein